MLQGLIVTCCPAAKRWPAGAAGAWTTKMHEPNSVVLVAVLPPAVATQDEVESSGSSDQRDGRPEEDPSPAATQSGAQRNFVPRSAGRPRPLRNPPPAGEGGPGLALRRRTQLHVDVNGRKGAYHAATLTAFDEAQFKQLLHVLVHALHIAPDPA